MNSYRVCRAAWTVLAAGLLTGPVTAPAQTLEGESLRQRQQIQQRVQKMASQLVHNFSRKKDRRNITNSCSS